MSAVNTLSSYFGGDRGLNDIVEEKQRYSEDIKPGWLIITKEKFLQNLKLILKSNVYLFLVRNGPWPETPRMTRVKNWYLCYKERNEGIERVTVYWSAKAYLSQHSIKVAKVLKALKHMEAVA